MKKQLKLLLAVLAAGIMAFAMTACGGSDDSSSGGDGQAADQSVEEVMDGTKTMAYFNKYVSGGAYTMEMKADYEGVTATTKTAVDGEMMYTLSETDGVGSIMIIRDGYQYVLDPSSKSGMKMSLDMASVTEIFSDESANYETAVSTGTEEINGATYDFEEFQVEGSSVKYYFDGKNLKYISTTMEGQAYVAEIISMEKGADPALFEVPADYTVIEF